MRFPIAIRRFLAGYLLLLLIAVGLFIPLLALLIRPQIIRNANEQLSAMVSIVESHIEHLEKGIEDDSLPSFLEALGSETGFRFTVFSESGKGVADSNFQVDNLESQLDRAEIKAAINDGNGYSKRESRFSKQEFLFVAKMYEPANSAHARGVIRVGTNTEAIESSISAVQKYFGLFAIALGLITAFATSWFASRTMRPLTTFSKAARRVGVGDYAANVPLNRLPNEWGKLGKAFRQMQSELNRREERLLNNNQRLEAVLSSMIEGVIGVDPDGEVMLANGAACEMLSLTRPELIGRRLIEIVRNPELGQAIEHTQTTRTFSQTEFKTLSVNQKTISASVSILADTERPGVAIVLHDITELRQLETMRRDFVANVSHELKTPLASIKAYAETLKLGAIHDNLKNIEFVEQIESAAELLNHQIQDLLQLARVESGKKTYSIARVDLNDACESCHLQFISIAADKNLNLILELDEPSPRTDADFEAVKTVLNNLIVNAIHYTPVQGTIRISTFTEDDWSIVSVSDTGIGIAEEEQSRIFERFYRVDKARSRDMGGTGLGLSIVKHLCQAFGGSVELESQLGKGSTFRVRFPKAQPVEEGSV